MARKIETISLDEVLCYDETVGGVTTTVRYLPLRKDADGVVLLRDEVLDGRRINATNDATYIGSEMDTWLNDAAAGYLSRFDAKMRAAIIPTAIKVKPPDADAVQEIARSVYLLSESEVGSGTVAEGDSMLDALKAHKGVTDANKARIALNSAGSASYWWLRSAGSASQTRYVVSGGNVNSSGASGSGCPRPAFKVANATMVSDGTEDTIYILPDAGRLYREMQFTAYCGQTDKRPKKRACRSISPTQRRMTCTCQTMPKTPTRLGWRARRIKSWCLATPRKKRTSGRSASKYTRSPAGARRAVSRW